MTMRMQLQQLMTQSLEKVEPEALLPEHAATIEGVKVLIERFGEELRFFSSTPDPRSASDGHFNRVPFTTAIFPDSAVRLHDLSLQAKELLEKLQHDRWQQPEDFKQLIVKIGKEFADESLESVQKKSADAISSLENKVYVQEHNVARLEESIASRREELDRLQKDIRAMTKVESAEVQLVFRYLSEISNEYSRHFAGQPNKHWKALVKEAKALEKVMKEADD